MPDARHYNRGKWTFVHRRYACVAAGDSQFHAACAAGGFLPRRGERSRAVRTRNFGVYFPSIHSVKETVVYFQSLSSLSRIALLEGSAFGRDATAFQQGQFSK